MENAELDVALEELENRLERLRALYEQYFMGIERIEPAIPRKDIDRRIYVLRREKIRNTAKRFKLQTIISRYNTFQQYWQRICREIDNGTYKRHVIKAERIAPGKLLTIAARRRLGRHAFDDIAAEPAQPAAQGGAPPDAPDALSERAPAGEAQPAAAASGSKALPPPKPVPPPKPGARPAKPATAPQPPVAARFAESLDLEMDFMGDWDPSASTAQTTPGARVPLAPSRPFGQALAQPLGLGSTTGPPLKAALSAPRPAPPRPAPPRLAPSRPAPPSAEAVAKPAPTPPNTGAANRPPTVSGASAPQRPASATAPPKPPLPPAPAAQKPAPPASAMHALAPLGAAPIAPAAKAAPKPAISPPVPLSDARVRELHARLVEAKRQTQDGATVSVEGLAKSLKATEAKLREQHKNRKIDFDVVIKDGKALLKPIVR